MIEQSDQSIHDLSRTELGANDLPRFNMPFELGLLMGAKRFGGKRQRAKAALIMIAEPYQLPAYLSDLGDNDPVAHHGGAHQVIRIVRRYLHATPDGKLLPGQQKLIDRFVQFKTDLPSIAARLEIGPSKIDPFSDYRSYMWLLAEFMDRVRAGP